MQLVVSKRLTLRGLFILDMLPKYIGARLFAALLESAASPLPFD